MARETGVERKRGVQREVLSDHHRMRCIIITLQKHTFYVFVTNVFGQVKRRSASFINGIDIGSILMLKEDTHHRETAVTGVVQSRVTVGVLRVDVCITTVEKLLYYLFMTLDTCKVQSCAAVLVLRVDVSITAVEKLLQQVCMTIDACQVHSCVAVLVLRINVNIIIVEKLLQ